MATENPSPEESFVFDIETAVTEMSRHHPEPPPEKHIIVLAWKDGGRTPATVSRLAPEVTCGKHRFKKDPQDPKVYNQV